MVQMIKNMDITIQNGNPNAGIGCQSKMVFTNPGGRASSAMSTTGVTVAFTLETASAATSVVFVIFHQIHAMCWNNRVYLLGCTYGYL
jgi:hypothetical protein